MLDKLTIKELKQLKEELNNYNSIADLKRDLQTIIVIKEIDREKDIRYRFNMDMFIKLNIFDPIELEVLKLNNINNLLDLEECDIDNLIGITQTIKDKILWVLKMYNLDDYVDKKGVK